MFIETSKCESAIEYAIEAVCTLLTNDWFYIYKSLVYIKINDRQQRPTTKNVTRMAIAPGSTTAQKVTYYYNG